VTCEVRVVRELARELASIYLAHHSTDFRQVKAIIMLNYLLPLL